MKEHNFKVGDEVRVVEKAWGCGVNVGEKGYVTDDSGGSRGAIQVDHNSCGWFYGVNGGKLELVSKKYPNPPHKHRDLIIEWAKGADIEFKSSCSGEWVACCRTPVWEVTTNYRILVPKVVKSPKDLEVDRIEDEMRAISEKQLKLAEDLANLKRHK